MATFPASSIQSTLEIATYTIDYSADIPTGGSIVSGTATHTPSSGTAVTVSCSVSTPYVYATVPAGLAVGIHYIDIKAVVSDADSPVVRLTIEVVYPAAVSRESMAGLITLLRSLTASTPNDYVVAGNPYWTDAQLQAVLDRHVYYVRSESLTPYEVIEAGGSVNCYDYQSKHRFFESQLAGTPVTRFNVLDETYTTIGTAAWTADYPRGRVTFGTTTGGVSRYLTGYSYDLNAAAADVWQQKAAHYVTAYDVSTDNHNLRRSQIIQNCLVMSKEYASGAKVVNVGFDRGDT